MSKEGDRASVFRTTKVRTKLKGDNSWMQRGNQAETDVDEKPWMAEVRASRLESAQESSPAASPTPATAPVDKPTLEKPPSSGYLIRGVFTQTENKPAPSSNGDRTSPSVKAPLAPKSSPPAPTEDQLSVEEHAKRTEAASNVLKKSSVRQRSYVLSAAKIFEPTEKDPDTSVNSSPSFVAKRVEITDDDETETPAATEPQTIPPPPSAPTPAPTLAPTLAPTPLPVSTPAPLLDTAPPPLPPRHSSPLPFRVPPQLPARPPPQPLVKTSVETVAAGEEVKAPKPVAPEPVALKPMEESTSWVALPQQDVKPGCTKVDTPLPVLTQEPTKEAGPSSWERELCEIKDSAPLRSVPGPGPGAQTRVVEESTVCEPLPPNKTSPGGDTLTELSDTLIFFDKRSTSLLDSPIEAVVPKPTSLVSKSVVAEPVPEISKCIVMTDDLLAFAEGPEESVKSVPSSPGLWSQDLLGGAESLPAPVGNSLDLLAQDVIPINTEHSLSTDVKEKTQQWEQKSTDTQSPTKTFTATTTDIRTKTYPASSGSPGAPATVSTSSSTDPFDPYPIGTTSPNSSSDPMPPLSAHSIKSSVTLNTPPAEELNSGFSESTHALEPLADDVTPIDTDTKSLSSRHSWARTWETDTSTDERPASCGEDQQTLVTFERKSLENDSPWDRWTSPSIVTVASTTEEEEEEEERETYSEPEPAMDWSVTTEESQREETPEPKKPFVYVKEYTNATATSLQNAALDDAGSGSDIQTSSSVDYSYSSPTSYNRAASSSTCNYCGQPVGNVARITIEHLNINCHPDCFKCGVCSRPMGDLLYSMFLHGGMVYCESCYSTLN